MSNRPPGQSSRPPMVTGNPSASTSTMAASGPPRVGPNPSSIPDNVKVSTFPPVAARATPVAPGHPPSTRPSSSPPAARTATAEQLEDAARMERRRTAGSHVVIALYRLVKACQLYDVANEAVQQMIPPVIEAIVSFCSVYDTDQVKVHFSKDQVFVHRRMMRAAREMYALALQLGALLGHCAINEIVFDRNVAADSMQRFARLIVDGQRDPRAAETLRDGTLAGVSVRHVTDVDVDVDPDESAIARVVKSYAASILILQSFHKQLAAGNHRGASEVKRIAQKLVALSEVHPELLVATAAGALPDDDPARLAVSTAVIVLAMTRNLTSDRGTLATVVQAALLADSGMARYGASLAAAHVPASTLGVMTTIGEFHPASVRRSVVAFEALSTETGSSEAVASGKGRTVLGALLETARRFNALRSPRLDAPRVTLDLAVKQLESEARTQDDQACVRLLVSAMGFYPSGTVVELDSGELALIAGVPSVALDFARPPVHIMTDANKQLLSKPVQVDLARQSPGQRPRAIKRPVDLDRVKAAQARA